MVLPSADEAAAWYVQTARAAVQSGERIDADAVELLMALAPDDAVIAAAIESAQVTDESGGLAAHAHVAYAWLLAAAATRDEALARETVTALETEVLRVYRPAHGLGRFDDDVAVALTLLAAHDLGRDDAHLMMAEELMLGVIRREWEGRSQHSLAVNCEAAVALAVLAERTGKPDYRERALEVMRGYAGSYRDLGVDAAPYVSALQVIR